MIELRPISQSSSEALLAGDVPADVRVASDYPTEFSVGVAAQVGSASPLGPWFIHRSEDDVVVAKSGRDDGVGAGRDRLRGGGRAGRPRRSVPGIAILVAHTRLDRPTSGRVLAKVVAYLPHLHDEETRVMGRIWECCTDAEIAAARAGFMADTSPEVQATSLGYLLPAIDPATRRSLIAAAPPTVSEAVLAIAERVLPAADVAHLRADIPAHA